MELEPGRADFLKRIDHELDACRVSRDNPVHKKLIGGLFTMKGLRMWGCQQYVFHRSLPMTLTNLAQAPGRRTHLALSSLEFIGAAETGTATKPGRLDLWMSICADWGIHPYELRNSNALPATLAMIEIQRRVTSESFVQGFAGFVIGAIVESSEFSHRRREALRLNYGVSDKSLGYFTDWPAPFENRDLIRTLAELCESEALQDLAVQAMRGVLRARWEYFEGIGVAAGL